MTISFAGTLPVGVVNVGLTASLAGLTAEITILQAEIADVAIALQGQIDVTANFPPDPASFGLAITAGLSLPEITAELNPTNWLTMGADLSADIAVRLGVIEAQLAIVSPLLDALDVGLGAIGISGWSYAGKAALFPGELSGATRFGFPGVAADENVQAVVIATESFPAWQALAAGIAIPAIQTTPIQHRLTPHGLRDGAGWNVGVFSVSARIRLFLASLRGAKAALELNASISVGLNLPDPQLILDGAAGAFADLGIDGIIDNLVDIDTDLTASVSGLQFQIDAILALISELNLQLAAEGLSFWVYSGPIGELGSSLAGELQSGLPGGTGNGAAIYGLTLAGGAPVMSDFGNIFKTAA